MRHCDFLIVGGGIAGLTLANTFDSFNQDYILIDKELPAAASKISSGIINPVTGKRFVLSWKYEMLRKYFLAFYKSIETNFSCEVIREKSILQILETPEEQNNWLSRTSDPEYQSYLDSQLLKNTWQFKLPEHAVIAKINSVYQIDSNKCISILRNDLLAKGKLIDKRFVYKWLKTDEDQLKWKDIVIQKAIVFTEGFRVMDNPFFNWLPFVKLKGEYLNVNIPELNLQDVYKSDYSLVPLEENIYWCGSNFSLTDKSLKPTDSEKLKQLLFLKNNLKTSFQVVGHHFGMRPACRDRRPVVGLHPRDSRICIFNGLGTKGFSLAPYCATQLVTHLLFQKELDPEIDLKRWLKKIEHPQLFNA